MSKDATAMLSVRKDDCPLPRNKKPRAILIAMWFPYLNPPVLPVLGEVLAAPGCRRKCNPRSSLKVDKWPDSK